MGKLLHSSLKSSRVTNRKIKVRPNGRIVAFPESFRSLVFLQLLE